MLLTGGRHDGLQVSYNSVRTIYSLRRLCKLSYHMYMYIHTCTRKIVHVILHTHTHRVWTKLTKA